MNEEGVPKARLVSPPLRLRRDYSHPLVSFQVRGEAVAGPGITPATSLDALISDDDLDRCVPRP